MLLRGIMSKNNIDFHCLNCLYSFKIKSKVELHEGVCENKYFHNIIMPSEDIKISELRLMDVKIILKIYSQQN